MPTEDMKADDRLTAGTTRLSGEQFNIVYNIPNTRCYIQNKLDIRIYVGRIMYTITEPSLMFIICRIYL